MNYYKENGKIYIKIASPTGSCNGCVFDDCGTCEEQCEGLNYIFKEAPTQTEKTPEIHEPTHPHHAIWREYTESLLAGKTKQLEYRTKRPEDFWRDSDMSTSWHTDIEYRIKPEPKLFWHMNGEKIVEYVEQVVPHDRARMSIHIDGIQVYFDTFTTHTFTTLEEAQAISRKVISLLETLEVK